MKCCFTACCFFSLIAWTNISANPTIGPGFFQPNTPITVTYDVTGTSLENLAAAYIWVWIPGNNTDAKYNINPASSNPSSNSARFTKLQADGKTLFTITFTPADFFNADISAETRIGMLLKGNDWSNGQTTDYLADFWDGSSYGLKLITPQWFPYFVSDGQSFTIKAETPVASTFELYLNNDLIDTKTSLTSYTYTHTVAQASGVSDIKIVASQNGNSREVSFQFIISVSSPEVVRPAGVIAGINYHDDHSKVTLSLWAPEKSSVYVLGDFSDWKVLPENLMNRDGEHFWLQLESLTPGEEYGYQYLVDETARIADPYADKILDPDDQYIPSSVYPELKSYPQEALSGNWYFNRVSVFQTNQTPYTWKVENFNKPAPEKLVIYELLIRDFFGSDGRSYQNLIDTIGYFKRLGVNAIELMPIMEFNGNDSWGYNPTFMFAPDKYYGPRNKLKEFIDKCHQNDIAVILDIAMNHQDIPNSYIMMDYDFSAGRPTVNNKWFNVSAKHPYNVFHDMNHESEYTKKYLDTVNYYWLKEYKIDGYRFDLTKGFTQNERCSGSTSNEQCFGQRDESRIGILKRMGDKIRETFPDAYLILEHFADNNEETELANYGFMFWGNLNHAYNNLTIGNSGDITWISHKTRGWNNPYLIGYMESHDEERLMVRNLQSGKTSGSYSTKDLNTAIDRIKAASVLFYPVPGPKMLWQFGELGYDVSIDFNGRVGAKPVRWEYLDDPKRLELFNHTADLIRLKNTYDVFTVGDATFGSSSLIRQLTLKNNPYTANPTSAEEMNVQIVVNFDLTSKIASVNFPHTGVWYDYYDEGKPFTVNSSSTNITLPPGGYKLYTDYPLDGDPVTSVETVSRGALLVYPNPTTGKFHLQVDDVHAVQLLDLQGRTQFYKREGSTLDISHLPAGLYVLKGHSKQGTLVQKVMKQ